MPRSIVLDTHAYVKKLKGAGFTEEQADVLASTQAELIEERLATKQDLKNLEAELKRDIKELEMRLTIRLGAIVTVGIAVVAALFKIL